ncbi:hypothetical protein BO71DRAFT_244497 [Aspergillus ellipticus CBS 707.79]|uniref:Uncharacterized protein n=1 Tax=Aspergillus ellipticus CBS 707.79 TaxID=1448320 RepID=A0A319D942_9EURO|nr:hypothetical protein BO71DRAFT_244497 [Aspergillus ellipticus CBS 707.79]
MWPQQTLPHYLGVFPATFHFHGIEIAHGSVESHRGLPAIAIFRGVQCLCKLWHNESSTSVSPRGKSRPFRPETAEQCFLIRIPGDLGQRWTDVGYGDLDRQGPRKICRDAVLGRGDINRYRILSPGTGREHSSAIKDAKKWRSILQKTSSFYRTQDPNQTQDPRIQSRVSK